MRKRAGLIQVVVSSQGKETLSHVLTAPVAGKHMDYVNYHFRQSLPARSSSFELSRWLVTPPHKRTNASLFGSHFCVSSVASSQLNWVLAVVKGDILFPAGTD